MRITTQHGGDHLAVPNYWKLKAAVVQHQNAQMKLEVLAAQTKHAFDTALREAGLDPAKTYTMDDATETVVETDTAPTE
jgi:hypothetical protein